MDSFREALFLFGLLIVSCGVDRASDSTLQQVAIEREEALHFAGVSKTMNEHWQESGLTFKDFESEVTNDFCNMNEQNLIACVEAINSVLGHNKNNQVLVHKDLTGDFATYVPTTLKFGSFLVASLVPPAKDLSTRVLMERRLKRLYTEHNAVRRVFKSSEQINVTPIIAHLRNRIVSKVPSDEAMIAGEGINAKLQIQFDPHTWILPTSYHEESPDEEFVGIGVQIQMVGDNFIISNVFEGSPAHKSGIYQKDIIKKVNGVAVEGLSNPDLVSLVRGEVGTTVSVVVQRGEKTLTFEIIRQRIIRENEVAKTIKTETGLNILYLKLGQFHSSTPSFFGAAFACYSLQSKALKEEQNLQGDTFDGIVLDLRGNPGGLVTEAVCLAGTFLAKGKVVTSMKNMKQEFLRDYENLDEGTTNGRLIILVDASSASASEMVSSAIQDHQTGFVMGTRSFGKGSFQGVSSWPKNGQISFGSTGGLYYRPDGNVSVQMQGVQPDFEVFKSPNPSEDDKFEIREENLYPYPLGRDLTKWKQPREKVVAAIQKCVDSTGTAKQKFAEQVDAAIAPDYQLDSAIDALKCLATPD